MFIRVFVFMLLCSLVLVVFYCNTYVNVSASTTASAGLVLVLLEVVWVVFVSYLMSNNSQGVGICSSTSTND